MTSSAAIANLVVVLLHCSYYLLLLLLLLVVLLKHFEVIVDESNHDATIMKASISHISYISRKWISTTFTHMTLRFYRLY